VIADWQRTFAEWLWSARWQQRPFLVAFPVLALRLVIAVTRDLREGYLSLRATSLVYTTLLSLAPLLAICFSVLKGIGAHNQIEPFLLQLLEPLGEQGRDIAERIVSFVDNIQVGVLGAVGVALLVYSVVALMHKIESAFNDIWHVAATRRFAQRFRDYLSVLLIGPLFMFLSVGMTASLKHAAALQSWLDIDLIGTAVGKVFLIVPYFLFGLAFAAIYMLMPNTRVRVMPALIAGFITGILWKVLGHFFGVFVTGSASYAAIYSAFAALILFMIWIYVGWLVVLAGASICYYLQNPSNQSISRREAHVSLRMREKMALQSCAEIGHAFYRQGHGMTLTRLSARQHVPALMIEDILDRLVDAGILALTAGRQPQYIPGRPFEETTVGGMLAALRAADEDAMPAGKRVRSLGPVQRILDKADAMTEKALGGITLKDLALEEEEG